MQEAGQTLSLLVICIFGAVSVLAGALSLLAMRAADPFRLQKTFALVSEIERRLEAEIKQIGEEEFVRVEANADAVLETAELKFASAERKRKSVAAAEQHLDRDNSNGGEGAPWLDQTLPEAERRLMLQRHLRGR
jgi:hypothetical protein